uniref:EGF-like calcium-binding domain-containing protein n=1 Tax=Cynoglossus semilaevis TaxID=244447 RepID=A0A3P8X237_CYNSE
PDPLPPVLFVDVNECEETNGGCEALCCNTIGSFYCRCPPGHVLTEDGRTCRGEYQNPLPAPLHQHQGLVLL